jgi:hypothetical protein
VRLLARVGRRVTDYHRWLLTKPCDYYHPLALQPFLGATPLGLARLQLPLALGSAPANSHVHTPKGL